ncbi:hypothetical protein IPA_00470 [Ignicoccus pacificus DSM 13166]|uniref:FAD/NAD(P)-binding domain-containing protein n=1 Tax=Ignicoccus pacificus DSM 13166 TaxID=940294 RepID=A0A977KAB7_9CREN|nr:hypothetical protein IPA_00470 [Ignicoccus pacificus DSM 13166]
MRVIVVGNGFGALSAAYAAEKNDLEIVQVGPEKFEYLPSLAKILSGRKKGEDLMTKPNFRWEHVNSMVKEVIEEGDKVIVTTEEGEKIEGDYAVVSPGALPWVPVEGAMPLYRVSHAVNIKKKLDEVGKDANVVVVGSGLVGLEAAGELAWSREAGLSNYRVKIVEAAPTISPTLPCNKVRPIILRKLKEHGIEYYLNAMVSDIKDGKVVTKDGREIDADVVIWAAGVQGPKVEIKCAQKGRRGFYDVDEYMKGVGCKRTYIIGDASNSKSLKMAEEAMRQGWYSILNIVGKKKEPYKPFLTAERPYCFITLGARDGVSVLNKVVIPGRLAPVMKDLFEVWMLRMARAAKMRPPVPV